MAEPVVSLPIPSTAGFETVRGAVNLLRDQFRAAALFTPELDAKMIVFSACKISPEEYLLDPGRRVNYFETEQIWSGAHRRLRHEPISRILGKREFWGQEFLINRVVLDPRSDTETVVDAALKIVTEEGRREAPLRILDLGTGSGCILLSILGELPNAWGIGTDINSAAVSTAGENARRLGLTSRVAFVCGNWSDAFSGPFDVIVSNPPYIRSSAIRTLEVDVRDYDPAVALDGGNDGLNAYRQIALGCFPDARQGSWIILEAGEGQADDIARLFVDGGWTSYVGDIRVFPDLGGINRVVAIKRQTEQR